MHYLDLTTTGGKRELMPRTAESQSDLRERYRDERRQASRTSFIAAGFVAAVGMPAWSIFDHLVAPADGWEFTIIRLWATAVILGSWLALFTAQGRRRPEPFGFGLVAPVQIAIAVMIVQLDDRHAAYALGMSLAIYASGFLLVWRLRWTVGLVALTLGSLAIGWMLAPEPVAAAEIATVAFYVVTASAIAIVGQMVRDRAAWREFQIKARLEAEQERTQELVSKLDRLSHEDPLTSLANRRAWDEAIGRACAQIKRSAGERTLSVLLCDVDRLKEINDTLGHAMGDVVLRAVAELLRERVRSADLVARIGGDEFAVLAVDSGEVDAATLAEDLRSRVESTQPGGPGVEAVTLSIGVAEWDGPDDTPDTLMLRADRRLYAAKARRNVVCAGDPLEPAAD